MHTGMAKWIIVAGALVTTIGLLLYLFPGILHWLGRLPGDIHIEKGNTRIYFPWVTMLLLSIVLTVLVNLFKQWLR